VSDAIYELSKVFGMFAGIFGGFWLLKRIIRWFGPALKMWRHKPWE